MLYNLRCLLRVINLVNILIGYIDDFVAKVLYKEST